MKKYLLLFCILMLIVPASASSFDLVRPNKDYWTCYDYSINYSRNNPEWGLVTMSNNPFFQHTSHMVNYRIDEDIMYIHDELYCSEYKITDWRDNEHDYYHFWDNKQTPLRNYYYLIDNRDVIK